MEYVKAPTYPIHPMPMPAPMPMPMPTPMPMPMPVVQPPAPIMHHPVHNDIHLHASYQQTSFVFPKPVHPKPVAVCSYNSAGSILVLFILLVIITRGFIAKC